MVRIITLLKKDWTLFIGLPIISIILPLVMLSVFQNLSNTTTTIGVLGFLEDFEEYEIVYVDDLESGVKLIENNELEVFFDSYNKEIYGSEKNPFLAEKVYNMIFDLKDTTILTNNQKNNRLSILFITLIIIMCSLSTTVMIGFERNTPLIKSMLLTPLRYSEFLLEKLIITLINFWCTIGVGYFILHLFNISISNKLNIFIYTTICLLALSLIGICITLSVKNIDLSNTLNSLFINFCFLVVIFAYQNGFDFFLPVTSGLYDIINFSEFPTIQFILLSIFVVLMAYISNTLFRKKMCS